MRAGVPHAKEPDLIARRECRQADRQLVRSHKIVSGWCREIILAHKNRRSGKRRRRTEIGDHAQAELRGVVWNKDGGAEKVIHAEGEIAIQNRFMPGVVSLFVPLLRARGNHKCPRRHHIGLEAPKIALDTDADVASAGKPRHLIGTVSQLHPRRIGIANGNIRAIGADGHAVGDDHVGDIARQFGRAHRDHILGRRGGLNRIASAAGAVVAARAAVAGRKDKQQGLRPGLPRQRVANGGVETGRRDVILGHVKVIPAIVRNENIGSRRGFLHERIRQERPESGIERHRKKLRCGSFAPELQWGGREYRPESIIGIGGFVTAAGNDPGDVSAVAVGINQAHC